MAKSTASTIITDILKRMGLNPGAAGDGSAERVDCLRQLNVSNQDIMSQHSLRFLLSTGNLNVVASAVAVPSTIDPAKTITLSRISGDGEIVYKSPDEWYRENVDTYGEGAAQTEPTIYTVAGANFLFKPAALTVTVPYIAQLRVTALADDSATTSQLPEGYENTLLAVDAEAELRRVNNEPQWQELKARANAIREALYNSERTTKLVAKTDREQKERKIEKATLSDEAAP